MLEQTLESINKTLERIAIALENIKTEDVTNNIADTMQHSMQGLQAPQITPVVSLETQTTIPVNSEPESFTQEQLAVAMSNAVSAGKMNVVMTILNQFGVQALTQINPADYNSLATKLKEAGVEV